MNYIILNQNGIRSLEMNSIKSFFKMFLFLFKYSKKVTIGIILFTIILGLLPVFETYYIAYITTEYLNEGISLNSLDYNILLLPLLAITIIWLLYNTIEEYRNNRNMDILEQALKQR